MSAAKTQAKIFEIQLAAWSALDRGLANAPELAHADPQLVAMDVAQFDPKVESLTPDYPAWAEAALVEAVSRWQSSLKGRTKL